MIELTNEPVTGEFGPAQQNYRHSMGIRRVSSGCMLPATNPSSLTNRDWSSSCICKENWWALPESSGKEGVYGPNYMVLLSVSALLSIILRSPPDMNRHRARLELFLIVAC
jgi:hypothetical protein